MEDSVRQTNAIIDALGIDRERSFISGENVMVRCPFAAVEGHKNKVDTKPSFGLKLTREGFKANCFTCAKKADSLRGLVSLMRKYGLLPPSINVYIILNSIKVSFPGYYKRLKSIEEVENPKRKGGLDFTNKFWDYQKMRKIPETIIDKFMIRYSKIDATLIFPLYDYSGDYRGYVEKQLRDYPTKYVNHAKVKNVLYGESLVKTDKIIVVEGMYDVLRVYLFLMIMKKLGEYSVVGTIGANVSEGQVEKLIFLGKVFLLMGDNDFAGKKAMGVIHRGLRKKAPLIFRIPYGKKDPAKLGLKEFGEALSKAVIY